MGARVPLASNLFKDDLSLQACLEHNAAHVTPGSSGEHVHLIQIALADIDNLSIDSSELEGKLYGPSTAAVVLAFKRKRKIINFSYQTSEDDIVGKMTIAALDKEMFDRQYTPQHKLGQCKRLVPIASSPVVEFSKFNKKFPV
jgi:hypothetical protein